MGAAVETAFDVHAVADDFATAVLTDRCHPLNGTLKRIEDVYLARCRRDRKAQVIVVAAYLASRHGLTIPTL
jgi:hypothetical protein